MGLPDFLCIGAQKAGTKWLTRVLQERPDVFVPPLWETHFFDSVGEQLPKKISPKMLMRRAKRTATVPESGDFQAYLDAICASGRTDLEWYKTVYSWPAEHGQKSGDITPSYLELTEDQVAYAREILGPIKLVLIVRHPAARLASQIRMWAGRMDTPPETEQQWFDHLAHVIGAAPRGAYSRGIPLWRSHFGSAQLLCLPFGNLARDPAGMIRSIETHLGLPHFENYAMIDETVHATTKYEIPAAVRTVINEMTQSETDFLRQEFGDEFFAKI